MTQASSINSNNISLEGEKKKFFSAAFMHNAAQNVKTNIKLMIVLFVLHMAAAPLVLTAAICQIPTYAINIDLDIYMVIAVISTAMGAAGGIICALSVFSYLYKKSNVDMRMSLPMTTAQRFFSDFLSGLFLYIAPFITAQLFTWALMLIGHLTLDGKTFYRSPEFNGDTVDTTGWVCDIFKGIAPMLWRGILGGLILLIMFYAVTVIVAACCGSIFENVAYNILLNILVPLAVYIGCWAITENAAGMSIDRIIFKPLTFCGPGGAAIGLVMAINSLITQIENEGSYTIAADASNYSFGQWCAAAIIITIIFIAAAFLIYRKRNAEDTGKPVVFGIFYHIIMVLCIFCISYAFLADDNIIPMIIITAILYMIFHVVRNRGFAHIVKGIIMYAAALGVCAGSLGIIEATNSFGLAKYVPDPSDVISVTIPYNGIFDENSYGYINIYSDSMCTLTDESSINAITDIHRNYVEHYLNDDDFMYVNSMEIAYKLKSGRTIFRRIDIEGNEITELSRLDMTEEMKRQRAEKTAEIVMDQNETIEYLIENSNVNLTVSLSPQWRYSVGSTDMDGTISVPYLKMPGDFAEKLAEALQKDILSETSEEYYTPSGKIYYLKICSPSPLTIKDSYTETLAYLRTCGFTELPENTVNIAESYMSSSMDICMDNTALRKKISGEDSVTVTAGCSDYTYFNSADGQYTYISIPSYTHVWYISENHASADEKYTEDINALLNVSKKMYISDQICYTIRVDGTTAAIPAEYNELAERVFMRMTADYFINFTENTPVYGDPTDENIFFIRSFTELYGRDKIESALEYYYGSLASGICDAMFDFASQYNG